MVKQASHKRAHVIRFYLHEMCRIRKSIVTEGRLEGGESGVGGEWLLMGTGFLLGERKMF